MWKCTKWAFAMSDLWKARRSGGVVRVNVVIHYSEVEPCPSASPTVGVNSAVFLQHVFLQHVFLHLVYKLFRGKILD